MQLTPHQEEKFAEIKTLLRKKEKRIILKGSAGVGKTTLASELVKFLRRDHTYNTDYNNGEVYVTAPTNKALAVLQTKIDSPVIFKTIHSACRLMMFIDKHTGFATFVRQKFFGKKKGDEFEHCKAAVVDEVSMLNSDFLGKTVIEEGKEVYKKGYLDDFKFPIIFLGDDKQLNPVGETISPIWTKDWPVVELTEIVRQGEGNPIIELSRDIDLIYFKVPNIINERGYYYNNSRNSIIESLAESNGTDDFKYLAYTNDEVNAMNKATRERIYGSLVSKIEKGETIIFKTPLASYFTNMEVKVESVDIISSDILVPRQDTKYGQNHEAEGAMDTIKMKYYRINDSFNVVHEASEYIYKTVFETLKQNNKIYGWDGRGYHYFANQFANINYNHGVTVHTSQGSTYKEAAINIGNIDFNRNAEEKQRMLYTAITRASNLVILNNVK